MTLQDAGLLFLALFPFTLVGVATVAMIRRRMKNKAPKLELVQEQKPRSKKKKSKRGKRK